MAAVTAVVDESASVNAAVMQPFPSPGAHQERAAREFLEGPYYWEEGGNADIDWWSKLWHHVRFGGLKALGGAEAIGEVVANTLGLTESKYQYVIDALEADEYRREQEERDEEDRRRMAIERSEMLRGGGSTVIDHQPKDEVEGVELGQAVISLPGDDGHTPGAIVDVPLA